MRRLYALLSGRQIVRWVLVALVFLVIADGFVTNVLVHHDIAHEGNPFLASLAGSGAMLAVKAVGAAACAFLLWDIYKHWPTLGVFSSYIALFAYAGIVLWNISLYLVAHA